jgi:pyrroloquinoline quinone (PQQ) biosynthesis protein C
MTPEEALDIITAVLAPRSLSELQINVFRGAFLKQSYLKMSRSLNHKEGYIKDVGAELWQLLTEALGVAACNYKSLGLQTRAIFGSN